MVEVADVAIVRGRAEGQRVTPKVPLKDDNTKGHHGDPEHGEGGFSAGETRIEKRDTRHHDKHHTGGHQDEGLVSGLIPLVQIFGP